MCFDLEKKASFSYKGTVVLLLTFILAILVRWAFFFFWSYSMLMLDPE